jgi:hypothetical protein
MMGGTLCPDESGLEKSPDGFCNGGKCESTLIFRTQHGGRLYRNNYQYRCFHDGQINPLWTLIYNGMGIKKAAKAYEADFDTKIKYLSDWQDCEVLDERRGTYLIIDKLGRRSIRITWS